VDRVVSEDGLVALRRRGNGVGGVDSHVSGEPGRNFRLTK